LNPSESPSVTRASIENLTLAALHVYFIVVRRALSQPRVFELFNRLLGGPGVIRLLVEEWIRPKSGEHVLDLGCGLAPVLPYLPDDVSYVGIDVSAPYIEAARQRHGRRGTFVHGDVTTIDLAAFGEFDHVLVLALLHHLSDSEVTALLRQVTRHVRRGGSIITLDPSVENASPIARAIIASDRGAYSMRAQDVYRALLAPYGSVTLAYRSDLLRIPYSHVLARVVVDGGPGMSHESSETAVTRDTVVSSPLAVPIPD
jgi:SAM-dependent methyltransferase